jgi:AmmeMemoRadiSam system protein A
MLLLNESEQILLLAWARKALEARVRGIERKREQAPAGSLGEPRGAFVTLIKRARLRGCIGFIEAAKPLYRTVEECAVAAALHDPRFDPVHADELDELHLEISVLSVLMEVRPEEVEVGRHGLLISEGWQRGLLLPQVAVEWKWDREQFLQATCQKAGLAPEAWRHGARIQAFTAQIFGERVVEPHALHHAS